VSNQDGWLPHLICFPGCQTEINRLSASRKDLYYAVMKSSKSLFADILIWIEKCDAMLIRVLMQLR
jgi:hypothetical protein